MSATKVYIQYPYDGSCHHTSRSWVAIMTVSVVQIVDGHIQFMYSCTGISIIVNINIWLASHSCFHLRRQLPIRYQNHLNPQWFRKLSNLDRLVAFHWYKIFRQCHALYKGKLQTQIWTHPYLEISCPSLCMLNLHPPHWLHWSSCFLDMLSRGYKEL